MEVLFGCARAFSRSFGKDAIRASHIFFVWRHLYHLDVVQSAAASPSGIGKSQGRSGVFAGRLLIFLPIFKALEIDFWSCLRSGSFSLEGPGFV